MYYTVKKALLGKFHVHYECPQCKTSLVSTVESAGTNDTCPECQAQFVVLDRVFRELLTIVMRRLLHVLSVAENYDSQPRKSLEVEHVLVETRSDCSLMNSGST